MHRRAERWQTHHVAKRRSAGELEAEVLSVLWETEEALSAREVLARLKGSLAYTTVTTVLTRLVDKGIVQREEVKKSFVYRSSVSESELVSNRLNKILEAAADRHGALAGFVTSLDGEDRVEVMNLLEQLTGDP